MLLNSVGFVWNKKKWKLGERGPAPLIERKGSMGGSVGVGGSENVSDGGEGSSDGGVGNAVSVAVVGLTAIGEGDGESESGIVESAAPHDQLGHEDMGGEETTTSTHATTQAAHSLTASLTDIPLDQHHQQQQQLHHLHHLPKDTTHSQDSTTAALSHTHSHPHTLSSASQNSDHVVTFS